MPVPVPSRLEVECDAELDAPSARRILARILSRLRLGDSMARALIELLLALKALASEFTLARRSLRFRPLPLATVRRASEAPRGRLLRGEVMKLAGLDISASLPDAPPAPAAVAEVSTTAIMGGAPTCARHCSVCFAPAAPVVALLMLRWEREVDT